MAVASELEEVVRDRPPGRIVVRARGVRTKTAGSLVFAGGLIQFFVKAVTAIPLVFVKYRTEMVKILAQITVGGSLLIVVGGTVGIIFAMATAVGVEVGIQGFQGLHIIGLAPLAGYLSAYANTREIAPLITAVALASQLGCKFTAELGAMRINEEIDALELMAVPPIPFLVTTRMVATSIAVIPLYLVGLFGAYFATQITITVLYGQSIGTYDHYFHIFLQPGDVFLSLCKVLIFTLMIIPIHCYYGYYATGGPEGVGMAAGRAIRTTSVCIAFGDMLMSLLFWGTAQAVGISA
jgi:phospholipid/cholesterol/gamma-HCH transport system permease protein